MTHSKITPIISRVLVVDDDTTQLNVLCGLVEKAGLKPVPFKNAETALAALSHDSPPDLIITDLYMPGIDGWRFCRLLRSPEYAQFNQTPILVVSATFSGDEPSRITSELGANAFMSMPVDGKQFIETVQALLKGEKPQDLLKVLIVEDSQLVSKRLLKAFQAHGYLADEAPSIQEALAMIGRTAYDTVVLDYHLPDGLGDGLLEALVEKSPDCICIMMTADPQPQLALTWLKIGAAAYLQKPFEPEYLISQCERACRERALLRIQDLLELRTRQLQESEEKYRSLIQYSSDPIFAFNSDETYRFVNEAFARNFGKKPNEIIGKTPYAVFSPEEAEKRLVLVRRVFKTGEKGEIEVKVTSHSLEERYFLTLVDPIKDDQGNVLYVTCISKDITERKQAENEIKKKSSLINQSQEIAHIGSWELDLATNRLTWSDETYRIFGLQPQEFSVTYEAFLEAVHPEDCHAVDDTYSRSVREGRDSYEIEHRVIRKDNGEIRHVYEKCFHERESSGNIIRSVGIVQDITERKHLYAAQKSRLIALTRPLDQHEGIEFADLFDLDAIQRLQDDFSNATGVASIITRPDGTPITQPSNFCRLCKDIIRRTDQGQVNCFSSDAIIGCHHPEGPVIQPCMSGGLWDAGAGISVGSRHIANWLVGQVRDETQTEEKMRDYARLIGADETAVVEAFREVPAMSQSQFQLVAQALFTIASQLSSMAYQNVQQARFITERKQAEEELSRSEKKFRNYFELPIVGMAVTSPNKGWLEINAKICELLGYKPEELLKLTWADLTPGEDLKAEEAVFNRSIKEKTDSSKTFEKRYIRKDGSILHAIVSTNCIRKDDGNVDYFLSVVQDITERKQAEEKLMISEQHFRSLFEQTAVGVAITDAHSGKFIKINQVFCEILGYTPEEMQDVEFKTLTHPDDVQISLEKMNLLLTGAIGKFSMEKRYVRKNGSVVWVDLSAASMWEPGDLPTSYVAIVQDITPRKKIEQALHESEERYHLIDEASQDLIYSYDRQSRFTHANSSMCKLLGLEPEQIIGKTHEELGFPQEQCAKWAKLHKQVYDTKSTVISETITPIQGGEPLYFEVVLNPIHDDTGTIIGIAGTTRDINARKRAEARINEQLNELRRWHNATLGREDRILELKREVNKLLAEAGKPPRFASVVEVKHE